MQNETLSPIVFSPNQIVEEIENKSIYVGPIIYNHLQLIITNDSKNRFFVKFRAVKLSKFGRF